MNRQEYMAIQAERNTLQRMLERIPAENVLDRASLEARLEEVEEWLAEASEPEREPARAILTFNGRPVTGSEGILADFATKALAAFTDSITAVAASLHSPLAPTGPIPNRQQHQMMITGTARGSFGFELQESLAQLDLEGDSTVARALVSTQNLLAGSIGVDDEQLAEAAADMDQRALEKIRGFVSILTDNEAFCTFKHADKVFQFSDAGQVRRSLERLSQDYLSEAEQTLTVRFGGALPHRGSCEFQLEGSDEWLTARIGPAVENPDSLNDHRLQWVSASMLVTQAGRGKPRYKLLKLPEWPVIS